MRTVGKVSVLLGLTLACYQAGGAISLELRQELTPYNYLSRSGVPISITVSNPPGSNGQMPTGDEGNESAGSSAAPLSTQHLFRGLISFGAVPGLTRTNWQSVSNSVALHDGSAAFSGSVAELMRLPVAKSGSTVLMVLRRAHVGAPYFTRQLSFGFGSVVSVPETDYNGVALPAAIDPNSYWLAEPFTTNNHQNAGYYWSPNARQVFAVQAGPLSVTWRKAEAYTAATIPSYHNPGGTDFQTNGLSIYLLYTARYVVSGSAVKPPRTMFWTEREFRNLGKPIAVPAARVGGVTVVYNNNFPKTVVQEYRGPGYTAPTDGSTNQTLPELRTLWYDQQQGNIYAFNAEGRVFMELLGDLRPDGQTREHLGFEIVDVFKAPDPMDLNADLGERLLPPPPATVEELRPDPVLQYSGRSFAYHHSRAGTDKTELYGTRETQNLNDYLVHWMEEGDQGLHWPRYLARYHIGWPADISRYSLYLRPLVASEEEAKSTAVKLSTANVPIIEYQDPLDQPRAKLTPEFNFYTWLNTNYPAHRTLLRFSAGGSIAFERVFSFLSPNLKSADFAGSVATSLSSWDPTNTVFHWPDPLRAPRVESLTANVGQRLSPPSGEPNYADFYLAGHINQSTGTSFDPNAYLDPFVVGFDAASLGAIIPVNAIPGANTLEVWWFRSNTVSAGPNAGNNLMGFTTVYWPSVLATYTLQWSSDSPKIVLASKLGSGTLNSLQALGTIYYQNDPALPGYNPNEEHAIMSGGTAFATRDDLNITNTANYSSAAFVLLEYLAEDGRPAIQPFQVVREDPSLGYVFDYIVSAGQILQPPPPLMFLGKPVVGTGDSAINWNQEPTRQDGDLPGNWDNNRDGSGPYGHYKRFTYRDRNNNYWVYRAAHAGLPALQFGEYITEGGTFAALPAATAVVNQPFVYYVHASRQAEFLTLSVSGPAAAWLSASGLSLRGTPTATGSYTVELVVTDRYERTSVTNTLSLTVASSGSVVALGPLAITCTNAYSGSELVYSNRPPFLAVSPNASNSFTMRYYYKTAPSFAWPGKASPPPTGSIVPYLRAVDFDTGEFTGGDGTSTNTTALDIVYRPIWPERDASGQPLRALNYGATLTKPANGLPGVRDMKSTFLYYQQSIAADITDASVSAVLHDPTREKHVSLAPTLAKLPDGVNAQYYQGKYYFANLPPHLASRVYYEPNRGAKGSLVLKGEFKEETMSASYLLLNVLRGSDLLAVKALCPAGDADYTNWVALVDGLATDVETFYEDPSKPGTYIPDPGRTVSVPVDMLAEVTSDNMAVDSYALSPIGPGSGYIILLEASGTAFTKPGDPVAMHVFKVGGELDPGELKAMAAANPLSELLTFQHTADLAGRFAEYNYEWRIAAPVDGVPPAKDESMSKYSPLTNVQTDLPRYILGGAGVQALGDNYVIMRYCATNTSHPLCGIWSKWTEPVLAEGWIKRVLAGLNPFNQRIRDLYNNQVNTQVSMLAQAGHRWEGDIALNLDTMNDYGLIEIYETVLRRGRMLSIDSGYNYGPANDALLLAAGYLNDLYMMEGNEAWADAANPTIGIGTKDNTYGDIATALFAFKGQAASLLEEELALLRGRDDFLQPGVEVSPVYNRLVWNYTRGIDSGEVIYALNYNILDQNTDGVVDALDAAVLCPQGHGDAYGHYLTALKGYYSLLMNSRFDWVPRTEAVNVLGKAVQVDYMDERKFAAAAAALARAGQQVFDLTWRRDYQPIGCVGWEHFATSRTNTQRAVTSNRHWGMDHWACRTSQGAYLNWVIGNAILPDVDPNPLHEGIQKIDRSTVTELLEIPATAQAVQSALDNAEGGLSPLGLPEGGLAFDLNPSAVVGTENGTHFEQIYQRAKVALNNAVASFDDAKDVTRLMRSEQDSLEDFQTAVEKQETAYNNALIELYGTPYPDDMGPGNTYKQDYAGPDYMHYMYVETPELAFPEVWNYSESTDFEIDFQDFPEDWLTQHYTDFDWYTFQDLENPNYTNYMVYNLGPHGFSDKPSSWTGRRASPGKIQQAISEFIVAHGKLKRQLFDAAGQKADLDKAVSLFNTEVAEHNELHALQRDLLIAEQTLESAKFANELFEKTMEIAKKVEEQYTEAMKDLLPQVLIVGLANGGDMTFGARAAIQGAKAASTSIAEAIQYAASYAVKALEFSTETAKRWEEFENITPMEWKKEMRDKVMEIAEEIEDAQGELWDINGVLRELDDANRNLRALIAEGDRIQAERETFRQRSAAVIQGYRTRDAAFRIFRNEKLERYKTLFDLAARYSLLAANAYDYETGLLHTDGGRAFVKRINNSRALGVVRNGEPQYAGSATGDPGLSSALAEMKADWNVLRGRLGFNNPDAYGTTVSLRTECLRILPTSDGDSNWKDVLQLARKANILDDRDVRRFCMQAGNGGSLPVPGIVLTFSTTISEGNNLFGQQLAAGDHAFSPSSFATKIFGVGVALEGYHGMDEPDLVSPSDPSDWFLDPLGLSATPYIYLVPVGVDSMRSPPLGDVNTVRTWAVDDLAIPMPFNIGASDFSSAALWQSSDSLTEALFAIRKHQAFRPVSSASFFSRDLYGSSGTLQRSQFTNNRLVGRSVWNSQWKLVIPGRTLLNDPNQGLDRFLQTVTDIKLHFVTYSYSGN